MSQEPPVEDPLSTDELTELLADVEGTTPEAIAQEAEEIEIEPPGEADILNE